MRDQVGAPFLERFLRVVPFAASRPLRRAIPQAPVSQPTIESHFVIPQHAGIRLELWVLHGWRFCFRVEDFEFRISALASGLGRPLRRKAITAIADSFSGRKLFVKPIGNHSAISQMSKTCRCRFEHSGKRDRPIEPVERAVVVANALITA